MVRDFFDLNNAPLRPIPEDVGNDNAPVGAPSDPLAPVSTTERQPRFVVEDFDTIQQQSANWLIKGLIPRVGVQIVAGPSMSGKSFLALHLLAAICQGREVFGLKVKKAAGIYFASEDAAGVRQRVVGLRSKVGPLGGGFRIVGQAPNLADQDDVGEVRKLVEEQRADLAKAGHRLGVIVVDTLSASIPGADENASHAMSPVLAALQTLAQDFELLVLLVAHTGKDEAKGVRGWSGLKSNADGVILVESEDGSGARVFTADKVKNGPAGRRFGFSLDVVPIGADEDGDQVTTCVVVELEGAPEGRRKVGRETPSVTLLKQAYNRLHPDRAHDVNLPDGRMCKGVRKVDLRDEAFAMGFGGTPPGAGDFPGSEDLRDAVTKWKDTRRKAFDRAVEDLVSRRGYARNAEMVWEVPSRRAF